MGTGSDKKGQDKKRIRERDCENCKAGRQTSECEATLVWTCKKERRRLRGEKDDGDGGARHKEKRKAKEKGGWIWREKTWEGLDLGKETK